MVKRLAVILTLTGTLLCQTTAVEPADPLIRISVNLVQIEAVVTAGEGKPVPGLTADDFELLEDGKPQKITHFSWVTRPRIAAPQQEPGTQPRRLKREEVHRAMAVIFDDLHTSTIDMIRLRPALKKFVAEQIQPGDLVSMATVNGGMGFYEQFTNNKAQLEKAADNLTVRAGGTIDAPIDEEIAGCQLELVRFERVMSRLNWAIRSLRTLPGRKAVAFFTGSLEIPVPPKCGSQVVRMHALMSETSNLANRAGVSFYTFDARGLTADSLQSRGQEVSIYLANETGGIFAGSRNDFSEQLAGAMRDTEGYYLIGYQPTITDNKPIYHKITLKVRGTGLSVRYNRGFLGSPNTDPESAGTASSTLSKKDSALLEALFSPFDAGTLRVRLTPFYTASPRGLNDVRKPLLRVRLDIGGTDLQLLDGPNGQKQLILMILAATYRADGKLMASESRKHTLTFSPEQLPRLAQGIVYHTEVGIPAPGPYQISIAVRDETSAATGSAGNFVWVPDFNGSRLVLSSLMPSVVQKGDARLLLFQSTVFGPKILLGRKMESSIRLVQDKTTVFDSGFSPVPRGETVGQIDISGGIQLPDSVKDGDYLVELTVRDPLLKSKEGTAVERSEITLGNKPQF